MIFGYVKYAWALSCMPLKLNQCVEMLINGNVNLM